MALRSNEQVDCYDVAYFTIYGTNKEVFKICAIGKHEKFRRIRSKLHTRIPDRYHRRGRLNYYQMRFVYFI